jgi:flagellar biosynthesis/type III secretory pathway chaperone
MVVTQEELDQRVAILKKLRNTLLRQRDKFQEYLHVLEKEEEDIEGGDLNKLEIHTKIEESIVHELYTFEKVVNPLEDMYNVAYPEKEKEIPAIKQSLHRLKEKVVKRNKKNQELLQRRMELVKKNIVSLRKPFGGRSPYSDNDTSSLVDITT